MSKRIYRVNELVTDTNNLDLLEDVSRAYIADKSFQYKVYVAGGDNYGKGIESYSKPHFHIIIENNSIEKFRILIPGNDWDSNKKLEILDNTTKDHSKVLDIIAKWLDEDWQNRNHLTNLNKIKQQWNFLNENNKYHKNI